MVQRKSAVMYGAWVACATISAGLLLAGGKALLAEPSGGKIGGTAAISSDPATRPYSPPVRFANEDTNLYWGNTHLHTNNSMDGVILGEATTTPEEAFRFAMGQEIVSASGMPAKLRHPLDFLVVSDHAEHLGVLPRLAKADSATIDWQPGRQWSEFLHSGDPKKIFSIYSQFHSAVKVPAELTQSIWQDVAKTADRFNDPGRFTAFIGYEWSSTPSGDNLHRNVIFRDGAAKATQMLPFSALDSTDPEKLWAFLRAYEAKTGGEVLAIPHNGNISNGRMFAPETFTGQPLTAAYARERARWEPVVEVTQLKGTSEAHSTLSPTDEFANFEIWDLGNFTATAKQPWMLPYEYARPALKSGLQFEQKLGVNPFKFGLVGGTDQHNGLTTTSEDNFIGQFRNSEPSADRYSRAMAPVKNVRENWRLGASGLTAVWAKENTREAIFDAMKRREVYATTGSRIQLRVFGGWNFAKSDVQRPDYAHIGYEKGVPMGGDLIRHAKAKAPSFMIAAAKDPDEANLDRIQVIKGWLDARGQAHEKIYDVALSDGRKVNPRTGKAPPVGSTVDVVNATYTNSIGAPELATVWSDPDFDPGQRAFYYVRVLEIPKPRWTAYDAKFFKIKMPANIPMTVQDRAFSSPIWYNPGR
ncbi:DUF3604 domain-containing protein [Rhizorhapis suberifaciens]|uniref:DUF3604 domain-containing protein n=1 Tax=Rhizorhapis suberifaciens TaxID=13656 RepID=A0A840HRR0_9SPHN|nr:DUF3604 domain-containing protein [Rhizorhapis suberifaciens]MBB4640822.1 hypothetical protein [Rhizorhapis suberifaciens]